MWPEQLKHLVNRSPPPPSPHPHPKAPKAETRRKTDRRTDRKTKDFGRKTDDRKILKEPSLEKFRLIMILYNSLSCEM